VTTPTSTNNKTTKIKRLREDRFCVFVLFLLSEFCFVVGPFFMFLSSLKSFFITKTIIIIKHNRKNLLHKERLCFNVGFS
jgi:hypothetical protein